MSLDDRMRRAYGRQLEDVARRVEEADGPPSYQPADVGLDGPRPTARLLAVAAVFVMVGVGVAAMIRLAGDETTPIATDPAAGTDPTNGSEPDDAGPVISVEPTIGDDASSTTESTETAEQQPTASALEGEAEGDDTADGSTELAAGVANSVCPSGVRAELERATTRYVSQAQGWNRKDDLIDEQDGPFYFQAWEPGYDGLVEVEIVLDQPVSANEIRVAQDPYTPVSGAITVTIGEESELLELEGTGGWKTLQFDQPIVLERFRLGRDQPETNIVEVLVCVEAPTEE